MKFRWFYYIILICLTACHSLSKKEHTSAESLFNEAKQLQNRGYYKEAIQQLRKLKSRWLYSKFFKEADLVIADIYFLQGEWSKAADAYTIFAKMVKTHLELDRVYFRIALATFHQLPSIPDRDLHLAKKTLEHFNKHLQLFPKSVYQKQSLKYKKQILSRLASKEWMTAKFHIAAGRNHSAIPYLKNLIKNFADHLPNDAPTIDSLKKKVSLFQTKTKRSSK